MKILGIGNAIVDVICKVDDNFITKNNLTKSTMKLFFDENEFKKLLSNLKIEETISGGSVANSVVGDEIRVKNMGSGTITIDSNSSETIDGSTSNYTLDVQYSAITLVSNGSTGWEVI